GAFVISSPSAASSIRRLIANRNLVQSRCCNRRDLVLHFDITQIDQGLQIIRGDRAELQALPYDVPKDPAQADGIVQSEARQTRFRFAHFFAFSPISLRRQALSNIAAAE